MPPRIKFLWGFSATIDKVLELEAQGLNRRQIEPIVGINKAQMSRATRLVLTAQGKTPDSGHLEIKNKAIELVKMLEAEEISLHTADVILVKFIHQVTGTHKTTYRKASGSVNADQQYASYKRVVAQLEGMCYGLDKMPEVVHSSITVEQRREISSRLADCRRIIERRINIIRKDENAEASS